LSGDAGIRIRKNRLLFKVISLKKEDGDVAFCATAYEQGSNVHSNQFHCDALFDEIQNRAIFDCL
jgi:hypothetical protein